LTRGRGLRGGPRRVCAYVKPCWGGLVRGEVAAAGVCMCIEPFVEDLLAVSQCVKC